MTRLFLPSYTAHYCTMETNVALIWLCDSCYGTTETKMVLFRTLLSFYLANCMTV